MKEWLLVFWLVALTVLGYAQDKTTVGDFTKSPTEHIISQIDQPFVVRSVAGLISRKQGDEGPLPDVLFEIQGPGVERKIRQAKTDEHGRFRIGHVPPGSYRFKATLDGFQSAMGIITVSKKAAKGEEMKIALLVGV